MGVTARINPALVSQSVTISPEGGRVLGCLVEKQLTTPQQYPLTLNALSLACSQATNREPIMTLDDYQLDRALDELKALHLVRFVLPSHGKSVTRYRHVLDEAYGLDSRRAALLAVLLLRGPQTAGELRARTGRMAEFTSVDEVHAELEVLADQPQPLARLLPRRPGQKEDRWQQLLATESGTTEGSPSPAGAVSEPSECARSGTMSSSTARSPRRAVPIDPAPVSRTGSRPWPRKMAALQDQIAELTTSLNALRHEPRGLTAETSPMAGVLHVGVVTGPARRIGPSGCLA